MKNHTLIDLTKKIGELNLQITTLKHELAANTQAKGKNTIATEEMTRETKGLSGIVVRWKGTDEQHHNIEIDADKSKLSSMAELKELVKIQTETMNKLIELLEKK